MRVPYSIASGRRWLALVGATLIGAGLIWVLNDISEDPGNSVVFIPGDLTAREAVAQLRSKQLRSNDRVVVKGVLENLNPDALAEAEQICAFADFGQEVDLLYPLLPDSSRLFRVNPLTGRSGLERVFLRREIRCDEEITPGWDGYEAGTPFACFGIPSGQSRLTVGCEVWSTHTGADTLVENYWETRIFLRGGQVLTGALYLFLLGGWLRAPRVRKRWARLAESREWQHHPRLLGPGVIDGEWEGRSVEIRSTRLLVDGDAVVLMKLPGYLAAAQVEAILDPDLDFDIELVLEPARLCSPYHSTENSDTLRVVLERLSQVFARIEDVLLGDLRSLSTAQDWTLELGMDWTALDAGGERRYLACPHDGGPTLLTRPLPLSAPDGLRIQSREAAPEAPELGHAILDAHISTATTEPDALSGVVDRVEFVEAVLELVQGHGGEVEDGELRVFHRGLIDRPSEIWSCMERLAHALEQSQEFLVFAQDTKDAGEPLPQTPVARFGTRAEAEAFAAERRARSKAESGDGWSMWGTDYWVVGPTDS